MSATDVAQHPPGPDIQDIKGPALEDPIPVTINPDPGPDGRNVVEGTPVSREETEFTPSTTRDPIKVDIKTEKVDIPKENNGEQQEPVKSEITIENKASNEKEANSETMRDMNTQNGSTKVVTHVNIPHSVEKDDGYAQTEATSMDYTPKAPTTVTLSNTYNAVDTARSRPLTETSVRDGTKMSFHTERGMSKREHRPEVETPFSVSAERKPLHTAQTRSHSDYFSKTSSSNRYANIASSLGQLYGFVPDPSDHRFPSKMQRMRRPPKLVRLATVTMSAK